MFSKGDIFTEIFCYPQGKPSFAALPTWCNNGENSIKHGKAKQSSSVSAQWNPSFGSARHAAENVKKNREEQSEQDDEDPRMVGATYVILFTLYCALFSLH